MPRPASLLQKVAIGGVRRLVTAVLAYVAWALLKVIAKLGVIVLPILAGVAVAILLPNQITSDSVVAISIPFVLSGVAASLVCYLYANSTTSNESLAKWKRNACPPHRRRQVCRGDLWQRRDFLATIAATGALSVLDPSYLAAKKH